MNNVYKSPKEKYLLNIAIILILISSGSQTFYRFHVAVMLLFFLLFSFIFYIHYPFKPNKHSLPFICFYCIYILINYYIINNNHVDSFRIIPYISFAVGSYLILSKIPWAVLVDRLIIIVGFMTAISIVVFVISELNILSPNIVDYNGASFLILFFHVVGWVEPFHRLSGIYWEPGAYQIVLNSTLIIAINYLNDKDKALKRKYFKYLLLIVIGSILTFSTTGYAILFIIAVYYYYLKYNSRGKAGVNILYFFISLICISFIAFLIVMSAPIQDKMNQLDNGGVNSAMVRQADNLALIQMITEKPVWGYGLASVEFEKRSEQLDNITSSNGDLFFAANFGIPFFIFIMIMSYSKAKHLSIPPLINVILFVLLNIGECFLYYPFVFIFLIQSSKGTKLVKC